MITIRQKSKSGDFRVGAGTATDVEKSAAPFPRGIETPHFRKLFWAWTISLLGDGIRTLALPLYIALHTGSAVAASAVMTAEVLPWLLTAVPAGALVDRLRPRRVVMNAHLLRAALTGGLVVAITTGRVNVALMCLFAFSLTIAETFAYPAQQVMLVALAREDELDEANSRFYTVHTVGLNLAGPLGAGALFAIEPAIAFAADGLTFILAATLLTGTPEIPARASAGKIRATRLAAEITYGVRLLGRITGLRVLVGVVAGATMAFAAVNALTPLYAVKDLRMRPDLVPSLFIVSAVGTIVAARLIVPIARKWSDGAALISSMAIAAVGMLLLGALHYIATVWVAAALVGIGLGGFNVLAAARRQRLTPPEAMGRVSGAYRLLGWGLMPVGAGLAGPVAAATSIGSVFVIAGGLLLVLLTGLARPLLRIASDTPAAARPCVDP